MPDLVKNILRIFNDFLNQVLILGSGGLHIGQAGEFDYSGTQVAFIAMTVVLFCDLIIILITNTHPLSRQSRR